MGIEFAIDMLDVVSHGAHGNYEFGGDLLGSEAPGDESKYLKLTFAQGINKWGSDRKSKLSSCTKGGEQLP